MRNNIDVIFSHARLTSKADTFKVNGIIKRETTAAILIDVIHDLDVPTDREPIWFPLSQVKSIHHTHSLVNNTFDSLVVTNWIAKQKGLI